MENNNQINDLWNTHLQVADCLTSLQNGQNDSHEGEWDRVVLSRLNCKELKKFVVKLKKMRNLYSPYIMVQTHWNRR